MLYLVMLGQVEVMQNGACRHHPIIQILNSESFQRFGFEVAQQAVHSRVLSINPVIECVGVKFSAKKRDKIIAFAPLKQDFFRFERIQELVYVLKTAFSRQKFAG